MTVSGAEGTKAEEVNVNKSLNGNDHIALRQPSGPGSLWVHGQLAADSCRGDQLEETIDLITGFKSRLDYWKN